LLLVVWRIYCTHPHISEGPHVHKIRVTLIVSFSVANLLIIFVPAYCKVYAYTYAYKSTRRSVGRRMDGRKRTERTRKGRMRKGMRMKWKNGSERGRKVE